MAFQMNSKLKKRKQEGLRGHDLCINITSILINSPHLVLNTYIPVEIELEKKFRFRKEHENRPTYLQIQTDMSAYKRSVPHSNVWI